MSTESFGMMNDLLGLEIKRIEDCATGAIYCQVVDSAFGGKLVPMRKHEFIKNYKILQESFRTIGITKTVPVEKLVKAKYQDNLEFLQWLYQWYKRSTGTESAVDYNAAVRRSLARGGRDYVFNAGASPSKSPSAPTKTKRPSCDRNLAKAKQAVNITEQQKSVEVQELRAKITELTQVAEDIEKERDFYFHKVLDVEKICKDGAGNESKRVLAVLYAKNDEKESFGQEKENFSQEKKSSNGCFADENGDKGGFESTPKKAALSWEASIMAESGNECQEKGDSVVEKEAMAQEDAETMLL